MRIDRRVSPNQTALWTVYELVNVQAARVPVAARSVPNQSRSWMADLGQKLARVVVRVVSEARWWVAALQVRIVVIR
jgi:hypothetical protein